MEPDEIEETEETEEGKPTIRIVVKMVGVKPLLLNNIQLADPTNPWAKKMAELRETGAKNRTEQWTDNSARTSFMGSFYDIPEIKGPAIPIENMKRSAVEGAKAIRRGAHVVRALFVLDAATPIIYDGPASREEMWKDGRFHLTRMMRTKNGASNTTYPMFTDWAVSATFELDVNILSPDKMTKIFEQAGRIEGLGACRKQGYGRYAALVKED